MQVRIDQAAIKELLGKEGLSGQLIATSERGTEEVLRWIYGNRTRYVVLEAHLGSGIPPSIAGLPLLGTASDIFTRICYVRRQSEVANMLGVSQQTISRYIAAESEPRLFRQQWLAIIAMLLDGGEPAS